MRLPAGRWSYGEGARGRGKLCRRKSKWEAVLASLLICFIPALFFGRLLQSGSAAAALSRAVSSIFGVIRQTLEQNSHEMLLVAAQDELVAPSRFFEPDAATQKPLLLLAVAAFPVRQLSSPQTLKPL